jgi:FtsZ-interacting cell division protein YlmF
MNAKRESMKKQRESTKEHERAKRKHERAERKHERAVKKQAKAEKKQMYKTVASAEAKRREINQQKITSCVKFEDAIYIYLYL